MAKATPSTIERVDPRLFALIVSEIAEDLARGLPYAAARTNAGVHHVSAEARSAVDLLFLTPPCLQVDS